MGNGGATGRRGRLGGYAGGAALPFSDNLKPPGGFPMRRSVSLRPRFRASRVAAVLWSWRPLRHPRPGHCGVGPGTPAVRAPRAGPLRQRVPPGRWSSAILPADLTLVPGDSLRLEGGSSMPRRGGDPGGGGPLPAGGGFFEGRSAPTARCWPAPRGRSPWRWWRCARGAPGGGGGPRPGRAGAGGQGGGEPCAGAHGGGAEPSASRPGLLGPGGPAGRRRPVALLRSLAWSG
jgi:hypothetical protein